MPRSHSKTLIPEQAIFFWPVRNASSPELLFVLRLWRHVLPRFRIVASAAISSTNPVVAQISDDKRPDRHNSHRKDHRDHAPHDELLRRIQGDGAAKYRAGNGEYGHNAK